MTEPLALFPLDTVLFPGGTLTLRIFEPRYLSMVSECLRNDRPFVVALIAEGSEVGAPAETHPVGTLARIVDWHQGEDGLLGIVALGGQRFRIDRTRTEPDGLQRCSGQPLRDPPPRSLPPEYATLSALLHKLLERTQSLHGRVEPAYEDADWVGLRMAELLPLDLEAKQALLEMEDAVARLARVDAALRELREET